MAIFEGRGEMPRKIPSFFLRLKKMSIFDIFYLSLQNPPFWAGSEFIGFALSSVRELHRSINKEPRASRNLKKIHFKQGDNG